MVKGQSMNKKYLKTVTPHTSDYLKQINIERLNYEFFKNFRSEHTRTAYRKDLLQFFAFISQEFGPLNWFQDMRQGHIIAYRDYLQTAGGRKDRPCSPKTVIRKLAAIKSYFNFLIEKEIVNTNPVSHVKRPRDEVMKETCDLTDKEVNQLIRSIDINKKSGHLHKAILAVMFSTGIRKSELINLKFADYREHQGFRILQFFGKGEKVCRVPVHPAACASLDQYILWMKDNNRSHSPNDWLFQPTVNRKNPDNLNKRLSPTSIDYIIKLHCKKAGITTDISPHSARATVIGSLLEDGEDLYKVAQLVNHASTKTTQMYDKRRRRLTDSPVFRLKYF